MNRLGVLTLISLLLFGCSHKYPSRIEAKLACYEEQFHANRTEDCEHDAETRQYVIIEYHNTKKEFGVVNRRYEY